MQRWQMQPERTVATLKALLQNKICREIINRRNYIQWEHNQIVISTEIGFTCHSTGCYLPCGCAKSGHFHSCCPSPVLNILLEILWKIVYIAIYECIISVILHIFKMGYQLRNIEQCYLPWPNVICLGKWQITCTATKKAITLPPALFPHSYPHNCYCFLTHLYLDSHLWALN